jgi:hypothetical protein
MHTFVIKSTEKLYVFQKWNTLRCVVCWKNGEQKYFIGRSEGISQFVNAVYLG